MTEAEALKIALAHLKKEKFLLLVDNRQPSLVTILTGEKLKGSWFGHPLGNIIYNTSNNLSARKELLVMKLIDGKYTFIAPELRDAAYALGGYVDDWQGKKLSPSAKRLLAKLEKAGTLPVNASNKADAALLEKLLLANGEQQHTDSGKHVKVLFSWEKTAKKLGHKVKNLPVEEAKRAWENHLWDFNKRHSSAFRLPWQKRALT
jgi:hypothetical protein